MSWPYVKLSTIATFKNGLNFSKENWGKGLKVIGVSDFKDYLYPDFSALDEINPNGVVKDQDYLLEGDILFVRSNGNRNLIGRSLLIKGMREKVSHSGFTIRARIIGEDIYAPFYFYLFRSEIIRSVLSVFGGGTNINNLNQGILGNLEVPRPEKITQKKIAAILSAYDDLIENNKRRIALLEKMAEEIYREWFVRFRFPGYQSAEFEKGIPKGWGARDLDSLCNITSSKRIFLSDYVEQGVPFFRSKEIIEKANGAEPSAPLYISEERFLDVSSKFGAPQKDDILITSVGTLGVAYLVNENERFYFKDGNLIWFKSLNAFVSRFVYFWMQTLDGKAKLLETTIGSSQQAFTIAGLKRVKLLLPSQDVLAKFDEIICPIRQQVSSLRDSNMVLNQTKNLLLPRLISGKLSVENLDIQFPPSMQELDKAVERRDSGHSG